VRQTPERQTPVRPTPDRWASRHRVSRHSSSADTEVRQREAWGGGGSADGGGVLTPTPGGLQIDEKKDSAKDFKAMLGATSPVGEDIPMQHYFRSAPHLLF